MREIKFRAWDKNVGVFYEWNPIMLTDWILDKDCELQQYTGLKDKNGKEIYEGDIVEEYSWIGWCSRCVGFQPLYDYLGETICHRCDGNYELTDIENLEVIGNIYENPELLGRRVV